MSNTALTLVITVSFPRCDKVKFSFTKVGSVRLQNDAFLLSVALQ